MATSNLNEPTSAANGNIPYTGSGDDKGDGSTLREAVTRINARIRELYGSQDSSNVVQTPFVDNDNIKDNAVDHDELAVRYTDSKADYGNISTNTTIDWSVAAVHQLTMTGAATLNFDEYKKGQVIDLLITGDEVVTFGTATGTPSINQVGSSTYDGTKNNIIQVLCTDDDDTPTFLFAVGDYVTDTNPA